LATKLKFAAGRNIAMKVPPHLYGSTVAFSRAIRIGNPLCVNLTP